MNTSGPASADHIYTMRIVSGRVMKTAPLQFVQKPPPQIAGEMQARIMIQLLQRHLGLRQTERAWLTQNSAAIDPILVAVDCEWNDKAPSRPIREIGVSVFDTRCLWKLSASSPMSELQRTITTYNFNLPSLRRRANPYLPDPGPHLLTYPLENCARVSKDHLRGIFSTMGHTTRKHRISLNTRNKIPVGHSFQNDAESLIAQGLPLPDGPFLDTNLIAEQLYRDEKLGASASGKKLATGILSVRGLVDGFRIPHKESLFHNAGNDAHFTMRILLMLAASSVKDMDLSETQRDTVALLEAIGRSPLEYMPDATISDGTIFRSKRVRKPGILRAKPSMKRAFNVKRLKLKIIRTPTSKNYTKDYSLKTWIQNAEKSLIAAQSAI